ncbi:MAG TPA: hypothetical protein VFS17_02575 [Methylophilaceae bacterium]|nr:hypothetical protein [Methylophilaceae bacterium]
MRKLILALLVLGLAPAIAQAEPQRMEDSKPACDSAKNSGKPCEPYHRRVKPKEPVPADRDSVIVPPDIPAEGLPNQQGGPAPDNSTSKPH